MSTSNLHIVVSREPFELIQSGIKKEEYRRIVPHWISRLFHPDGRAKQFDTVTFQHAYETHAPRVTVEFIRVEIGIPKPEWACGIVTQEPHYIIKLGNIL